MIRSLQVNTAEPIKITAALEAMTRGMCVYEDFANGGVKKSSDVAGFYLVDVAPNYDGINAVITPNDSGFENVAVGQKVLLIPVGHNRRYATNQITATGLVKGDKLKASAGLFVKASAGDTTAEWVYDGAYSDPTFTGMHVVQHV